MAVDKLVDSSQLDSNLTSIANAIRNKTGQSGSLSFPTGMVNAIASIQTGGSSTPQLQAKTATPSLSQQVISPDYGKDGLSSVTVNAITASLLQSLDADFVATNIKKGVDLFGRVGTYEGTGGSGGKAAQACDGMARVADTNLTATTVTLTVEKTGTYTVRWLGYRSSTSGTNGSQLYIGNTAYGSENTTFSVNSNGQTNKLTGIQLTAGQTITIRARSRGTNYYMWVMGLSIIEE